MKTKVQYKNIVTGTATIEDVDVGLTDADHIRIIKTALQAAYVGCKVTVNLLTKETPNED